MICAQTHNRDTTLSLHIANVAAAPGVENRLSVATNSMARAKHQTCAGRWWTTTIDTKIATLDARKELSQLLLFKTRATLEHHSTNQNNNNKHAYLEMVIGDSRPSIKL